MKESPDSLRKCADVADWCGEYKPSEIAADIRAHADAWDKEIWSHEDFLVKLCALLRLPYELSGEPDVLARIDALEGLCRRASELIYPEYHTGTVPPNEGEQWLNDCDILVPEDTISDGFGNEWAATCEHCGGKMQVVRPGKVQCAECG